MANTFWVGRERDDSDLGDSERYIYYEAFAKKPTLRKDGRWTQNNNKTFLQDFCPLEFEEVTGIKVGLGEVVEVKLVKVKGKK